MNTTDIVGLAAAVSTTSSFLPQAIKTIRTRETHGISLVMYTLFTLGTCFWLLYGVLVYSIPVIAANAITLVFASIILAYKLRYK